LSGPVENSRRFRPKKVHTLSAETSSDPSDNPAVERPAPRSRSGEVGRLFVSTWHCIITVRRAVVTPMLRPSPTNQPLRIAEAAAGARQRRRLARGAYEPVVTSFGRKAKIDPAAKIVAAKESCV
jgi:hypothetical protein